MPVTSEEIRRSLVDFARRWSLYSGSERAEAQTFLNELFVCYGTDRRAVGARLEDPQEGKFLDLIWPRICLIEMKRPSEAGRLAAHRRQALDYREHSADPRRNVPAPRYVVLCAFQRFEVWEPGALFAAFIATGALSLASATSAPAEEQHGSCRAAGQFAAGSAQQLGSGFGQAASSLAQLGQADDFVHSVHAILCEPRP